MSLFEIKQNPQGILCIGDDNLFYQDHGTYEISADDESWLHEALILFAINNDRCRNRYSNPNHVKSGDEFSYKGKIIASLDQNCNVIIKPEFENAYTNESGRKAIRRETQQEEVAYSRD